MQPLRFQRRGVGLCRQSTRDHDEPNPSVQCLLISPHDLAQPPADPIPRHRLAHTT